FCMAPRVYRFSKRLRALLLDRNRLDEKVKWPAQSDAAVLDLNECAATFERKFLLRADMHRAVNARNGYVLVRSERHRAVLGPQFNRAFRGKYFQSELLGEQRNALARRYGPAFQHAPVGIFPGNGRNAVLCRNLH